MDRRDDPTPPLRTGLSLQTVVEQYLQHGRPLSTAAFGFDPEQPLEEVVAGGFRYSAMRPAAYVQIERDVRLRHRGGELPATLLSTYLRGRYLNSELGLVPHGPPPATILRWLARCRPQASVRWSQAYFAEYGELLVDGRLRINFTRHGDRYRVTSLVPRIAGDGEDRTALLDLDFAPGDQASEGLAAWTAQAARLPKGRQRRAALQAVQRIAAWLPQP